MITLIVGPEEERFVVHQSVLCQSLMLAAMCLSDFKERRDQIIKLPEEEPYYIQLLLEYLYSRQYLTAKEAEFQSGRRAFENDPGYVEGNGGYSENICPFEEKHRTVFEVPSSPIHAKNIEVQSRIETATFRDPNDAYLYFPASPLTIHATESAKHAPRSAIAKRNAWELEIAVEHVKMYVLGDRYDLEDLKRLAMMNMLQHIYTKFNPTDILDLAAAIYPYITEGDSVFRPFFKDELLVILTNILQEDSVDVRGMFAGYIREDGLLAFDISEAFDDFGKGFRSWKSNMFLDHRKESIW